MRAHKNRDTQMLDLLEPQVKKLFGRGLSLFALPELDMPLYLLESATDNQNTDEQYSPAQVEAIWANMPYWAFAWSSGRALAKYILDNPETVKDKNIADFGAGSGIVAIAALKAGAKSAVAVDIDPQALLATMLNAAKNDVSLKVAKEIPEEGIDLLVVGDVLYDPRNHDLAQQLFAQETPLIWAESVAQTKLAEHGPVASYEGETYPNIGGFDEHKEIHIYQHKL